MARSSGFFFWAFPDRRCYSLPPLHFRPHSLTLHPRPYSIPLACLLAPISFPPIDTFWEITKRQLDEQRAESRIKDREVDELEEKHAVEIKVYKQKVKVWG